MTLPPPSSGSGSSNGVDHQSELNRINGLMAELQGMAEARNVSVEDLVDQVDRHVHRIQRPQHEPHRNPLTLQHIPASTSTEPRRAAENYISQANALQERIQNLNTTRHLPYELGTLPAPFDSVHPGWLSDPRGFEYHATRIGGVAFGRMVGNAERLLTATVQEIAERERTGASAPCTASDPESSDPGNDDTEDDTTLADVDPDSPLTHAPESSEAEGAATTTNPPQSQTPSFPDPSSVLPDDLLDASFDDFFDSLFAQNGPATTGSSSSAAGPCTDRLRPNAQTSSTTSTGTGLPKRTHNPPTANGLANSEAALGSNNARSAGGVEVARPHSAQRVSTAPQSTGQGIQNETLAPATPHPQAQAQPPALAQPAQTQSQTMGLPQRQHQHQSLQDVREFQEAADSPPPDIPVQAANAAQSNGPAPENLQGFSDPRGPPLHDDQKWNHQMQEHPNMVFLENFNNQWMSIDERSQYLYVLGQVGPQTFTIRVDFRNVATLSVSPRAARSMHQASLTSEHGHRRFPSLRNRHAHGLLRGPTLPHQ